MPKVQEVGMAKDANRDHRPTRRGLLQATVGLGLAAPLAACTPAASSSTSATTGPRPTSASPRSPGASRTLLAYYSRAGENYYNGGRRMLDVGNTHVIATMIQAAATVDTYRIEAVDAYPTAYDPTVARNVEEIRANARPAIARPLPDLSGYDTVLLGNPVWACRNR